MGADFGSIFLHNGGFTIEVFAENLTANRLLRLPPAGGTIATTADIGAAGGGTVTSVGLTLPNIFTVTNSPVTTAGDLTATLTSQTANTFLGVGDTNGAPTFKALTTADLPNAIPDTKLGNIPTSKLTGVLAPGQMAEGTNSDYFGIDVDASGGRIYWDTTNTEFRLRNNDNSGYVSLRVDNLIVEGATTTVSSETVTFADNRLLLNSNATATPSENAGLEIERGTSSNALIQWNEGDDAFEAGITGNILDLVRKNNGTFTNANLAGNIITITHNLRERHPELVVKNGSGRIITFTYNPVDDNNLTIDMSRLAPLTGTWEWYAKG